MTADMVIKFFTEYGWKITALATSGIFFIGFLKSLGIFEKLDTKIKKYVYFALSCVTSIVACTAYLCATHKFVWADWAATIACIIPFTLAMYGLYENTGLRGLCQTLLFKPLKNLSGKLICLFLKHNLNISSIKTLLSLFGQEVAKEAINVLEEKSSCDSVKKDANFNQVLVPPSDICAAETAESETLSDITNTDKSDAAEDLTKSPIKHDENMKEKITEEDKPEGNTAIQLKRNLPISLADLIKRPKS